MTDAGKITDAGQALKFMLAGNATFTVRSEATGNHLTFQVRNWKKAKHGTMHFVSVRTGNDYAKIGVVRDRTDLSLGGSRSDLPYEDPRVRGFGYVFDHLKRDVMPPKAEIWHEGTCGRCGKALTDPVSISSGLGPECRKKTGL
jgi:hypothetical protein